MGALPQGPHAGAESRLRRRHSPWSHVSHPSPFALPDTRAAKRDPRLVGPDESHFAAITDALDATVSEVSRRLAEARRQLRR